jgi:hypothetical protein
MQNLNALGGGGVADQVILKCILCARSSAVSGFRRKMLLSLFKMMAALRVHVVDRIDLVDPIRSYCITARQRVQGVAQVRYSKKRRVDHLKSARIRGTPLHLAQAGASANHVLKTPLLKRRQRRRV